MNEYINSLEENIINSTRDTDLIIETLQGIKGNTLSVGSGGSRVVAEYASLILSKKNQLLAKAIDPRDLEYLDLNLYDNIFISSYSGSNFGVRNSLKNELNKYVLTNREEPISDEKIIHYNMEHEHSFISINATLVPMSILLKYYLEEYFDEVIKEVFNNIDKELFMELTQEYVNIFSGVDTLASESFIESTLTESGISVPLIHEKYSYCHGRTTMNKDKQANTIYLGNRDTDLDRALIDAIKLQCSNICILDSKYSDYIVNDFYLTLQSLYLLRNIALSKDIDLSKIAYDQEVVKKLYYFKGSM